MALDISRIGAKGTPGERSWTSDESALYAISVVFWILALSRVDVSIAYPMLSIGYIVSALAGWLLFSESVGPARVAGIVVIIAGVWLVARS